MKWFISKIIYQVICGKGDHTPQFDEQVRLITASNEEEALQKAWDLGEREQDTFSNQKQELVQWRFVNVSDLYCIREWLDGAEVYSSVKEVDNADEYIDFINDKAAALQQKQSRQLLHLI